MQRSKEEVRVSSRAGAVVSLLWSRSLPSADVRVTQVRREIAEWLRTNRDFDVGEGTKLHTFLATDVDMAGAATADSSTPETW